MVTQRRIHSLYHRNVILPTPEDMVHSEPSPWASLTPIPDELWQDFINTSFEFLGDDSFVYLDPNQGEQTTMSEVIDSTASLIRPDVNLLSLADVETLIDSLPACSFCRGQHIKCDRQFPRCGACNRSDRECLYYDATLEKNVSRGLVLPD